MHFFLDGSGRLSGKQCSHRVRNRAASSQSGEKSKLTSIIWGLCCFEIIKTFYMKSFIVMFLILSVHKDINWHPSIPSWLRVRSRKSLLRVRSQSLMSETDITIKRTHSQSDTHLRGSVGENWQKEGCASSFVRGDVLCMRTKQSVTQHLSNIHLKTIFIFFLSLTSISAHLLWHLTQTSRNEIKGFVEIISPRRVA